MKKDLYQYLSNYLTDNKKQLFEDVIAKRTRHIAVVLEDIFQAHNTSAVLRSCDCFGVQDVHVVQSRNTLTISEDIVVGASKWLDIHQYHIPKEAHYVKPEVAGADVKPVYSPFQLAAHEKNIRGCLQGLKQKGYKIVATTPHTNDCELQDLPVDQPVALVFGTEMEGITDWVRDEADAFVRIPMYGFTESFNISVATAITLYQVGENMRKAGIKWQLTEEEQVEIKIKWAKKLLRNADGYIRRFYEDHDQSHKA